MARHLTSTVKDDFVGRLLWALSDPSGIPEKLFAELDPVPSIDWLVPFSKANYHNTDLNRFAITSENKVNDKPKFSLLSRPYPYSLDPLMSLISYGDYSSKWDDVMHHMARWLVRHLNDPILLIWLVKRGNKLHDELTFLINNRLDELAKLEHEGNTKELERIRANAPNEIPDIPMKKLWDLLLTNRIGAFNSYSNLKFWCDRFKREGLTTTLRIKLREMLTPHVLLFKSYSSAGEAHEARQIRDLVKWKIVLSTGYIHSDLSNLLKEKSWKSILSELLLDFSSLLRETLEIMRELDGAGDKSDSSYIYQPSIEQHPQNKGYHDWTALIGLTLDAWLATASEHPNTALFVAESWLKIPFSLFKRLSFFASSQGSAIPTNRSLEWILSDNHWWLWSPYTRRETLRLLVSLSPQLNTSLLKKLEQAILAGPSRNIFKHGIENECWRRIRDRKIWLRLAKIDQTDTELSATSKEKLQALCLDYPEWKITEDQCDEFPYLAGDLHWAGDEDGLHQSVPSLRKRKDFIKFLR